MAAVACIHVPWAPRITILASRLMDYKYIYIKLQGVVPIMLLLRRRLYECYEWPYISRAGGIAELMATVWMMERSCVL